MDNLDLEFDIIQDDLYYNNDMEENYFDKCNNFEEEYFEKVSKLKKSQGKIQRKSQIKRQKKIQSIKESKLRKEEKRIVCLLMPQYIGCIEQNNSFT